MNPIILSYRSVPAPTGCNDGWTWFASPDTDTFSPNDYAEAFHLNVNDIDQQTIKSVQDAVNNNFGGTRWVEISHTLLCLGCNATVTSTALCDLCNTESET